MTSYGLNPLMPELNPPANAAEIFYWGFYVLKGSLRDIFVSSKIS
jgi:hypothetical protein